jgi:hypothetical protein
MSAIGNVGILLGLTTRAGRPHSAFSRRHASRSRRQCSECSSPPLKLGWNARHGSTQARPFRRHGPPLAYRANADAELVGPWCSPGPCGVIRGWVPRTWPSDPPVSCTEGIPVAGLACCDNLTHAGHRGRKDRRPLWPMPGNVAVFAQLSVKEITLTAGKRTLVVMQSKFVRCHTT